MVWTTRHDYAKISLLETMCFDRIRTHVAKLNQCSTCKFDVGWTVVNTAKLVEAMNASMEVERAVYLGKAAE